MSVESLHIALQQSFSPDASLRDPAEEKMKNLKYVNGATTMLLQVAAEKQVQKEVRQAATIQLKNLSRECWTEQISAITGEPITFGENKKRVLIPDEDKVSIRNHLIDVLLSESEKSIRDLLAETLHTLAIHDYPEKWPNLLPTLLTVIGSNGTEGMTTTPSNETESALRVHNALLALRKIAKRYEYKSKERRGPLNEIVNLSFPLLLPLSQRLCNPEEHSLEAAMMLKQMLKIFWSSTQFFLPTADVSQIQPWFDILYAVLAKPLPEASTGLEPRNQPITVVERNAWPWWKVKKWAVQIMSRLFSRYGMPNYAEDEVKEFAKYFSTTVAPRFLGPVCETLNLRPSGQFCTDRVVHLCLSYVDLAVELAPTYKMLKPHLDFLMYKVCFPTICLTADDVELFINDPHEFVHKQNSPLADFYDPSMSAITLLTDLVRHRGRDVTQQLLAFLTDCVNRYAAATDESQKNHIEKDGALHAFGALAEYLLNMKKYASHLEGLLVTSVFPDFNSPIGFLRCRACWMVQKFSTVKWSDDGTNLRTLIQLVLQRLSDPALPVQIEASKALRYLIESDGAEVVLLPVLPNLLSEYFRIMNEIGNDEVVAALQVIIDKFGDHIEPHAVALVNQLSVAFSNYCAVGDDDDDSAMAAAQCLECIATVLKGICMRPDLFKHLEPNLIPIILKILGNDGEFIEYLEYALDILTFLTYFPTELSPQLWEAFPLIYQSFDQYAFDYLSLMVMPLENFIGKSPDYFLAAVTSDGVKYIDLIFKIVGRTLAEDRSSESECRKALSLYMTVLHNCNGKVDSYLSIINDVTLLKLSQQVNAEMPLTRIACYQIIGSCLFYNPLLELQELEKRGVTQQVMTEWTKDAAKMEKWLPRKLTVLGMASIFHLPTSSLPQSVASQLPQIMASAVEMCENMYDDAEKKEDEEDDVLEEEEEEVDEDEDGYGEDEDVTSETEEAYMDALNKLSGTGDISNFLVGEDWDQDGDDLDDDYTSPIDDIDQLIFLSETLTSAFQKEPEAYKQVQAALPPNVVASCQKVFAAAETQRAQIAQVKLTNAQAK